MKISPMRSTCELFAKKFVTVHVSEARNAYSLVSISGNIVLPWTPSPRCYKRSGSAGLVEAQAYIRALDAHIAVLESMVQRLPATVVQLTERVQQDSRTSSRPPSKRSAASQRPTAAPRAQWTSAGE
jgi:Family of unknown function (DUF6444)